jgi:hypothetical protein
VNEAESEDQEAPDSEYKPLELIESVNPLMVWVVDVPAGPT